MVIKSISFDLRIRKRRLPTKAEHPTPPVYEPTKIRGNPFMNPRFTESPKETPPPIRIVPIMVKENKPVFFDIIIKINPTRKLNITMKFLHRWVIFNANLALITLTNIPKTTNEPKKMDIHFS